MAKIDDSRSFVPHNQVFTVTDTTPLKDVLHYLSGEIKGFILQNSKQPRLLRGYVSGHELINLVKSGEWKHWKDQELFKLIEDPRVELSMIPMAEKTLNEADAAIFSGAATTIAQVVGPSDISLGFLFPDKLMDVHVSPQVFWCTNPQNSHPNAQPGRCSSCPFSVTA